MDSSNSRYVFKIIVGQHNIVIRSYRSLQDVFDTITGGCYGENFIREMIKVCLMHPELEKFKNNLNTAQLIDDFSYALMCVINDYLVNKPDVELYIYKAIEIIKQGGYHED